MLHKPQKILDRHQNYPTHSWPWSAYRHNFFITFLLSSSLKLKFHYADLETKSKVADFAMIFYCP